MKKLMILSTGGTIACTETEMGLSPTLSAEEIAAFIPEAGRIAELAVRTIFNLDSSNVQPEEWRVIAHEIDRCIGDVDGVVVLHGTDTMGYTASMLSFMLQGLSKPVVLTGSQLPIDHPQTDARKNLMNALMAASSDLQGVFVVFNGIIIRGTRVAKVRTLSQNAFESINCPPVGFIWGGSVHFNTPPESQARGTLKLDDRIDPNVFLLKLIPGTRPEIFDCIKNMGYRGVVIEGFGLGGVHSIRRNLLEKIRELTDCDIAVLITTQCRYEASDLTVYIPGREALSTGIIQGYDLTSECAVTKLMWVLGHSSEIGQIRNMMHQNYCGEISEELLHGNDQLANWP